MWDRALFIQASKNPDKGIIMTLLNVVHVDSNTETSVFIGEIDHLRQGIRGPGGLTRFQRATIIKRIFFKSCRIDCGYWGKRMMERKP